MKKLILILLLTIHAVNANARNSSDTLVKHNMTYGEFGGGYGTHGSFKWALNFINSTNRITTVCFVFSAHRDPGCPSDFSPGLFEMTAQQKLFMLGVMSGKVFYSGAANIRYTLKGGLSAGIVSTPTDYAKSGGWFSANYTYNLKSELTPGLLLNPTLELPLNRHFGFSFGLYANINLISPVFGLEGSMLFGKLRNKRPGEKDRPVKRHRPPFRNRK